MPAFHPRPAPRASHRPANGRRLLAAAAATALLALAGCAVGPDYQRPAVAAGASLPAFKEDGPWRPAAPALPDAHTPWWSQFGDPQLDALVAQALAANQTLQQADAAYRQAQAVVQGASAAFYPTVGLSASGGRGRSKSNGQSVLGDTHAWSLQAAWEPDLWGRVRRTVEAGSDSAQASAADLAAARLSI